MMWVYAKIIDMNKIKSYNKYIKGNIKKGDGINDEDRYNIRIFGGR